MLADLLPRERSGSYMACSACKLKTQKSETESHAQAEANGST
jgi:hypothetical protein